MEGHNSLSGLGQISNVMSLSGGGTLAGLSSVPAMTGSVQAVPVSGQLAWYDGIGQLVSGPAVQVELTGTDIARQFNQQVHAQYGQIQVQLLPHATAQQQVIQLPQQQVEPQHTVHQQQLSQDTNVKMEDDMFLTSNAPATQSDAKKSRVKTIGTDRVPCPICDKTVSCTATLRDHMRTHTGERPFPCSECNLAFSQRSNLRMHKRLHTGERPYMCGLCGKTFARSSHLPAHMRTHTGEKPYECEECGHAFITAQQLKNHHRVHTGEKPWKCDLCDAAFTHSSSLSTHKKKHTGNKPFECDKCSKKFFFTSALDKHLKVHSKTRPFKCGKCDNTFKYKESLTVHEQRYCGRHTEKRQRAPRKPDAKKPGPKPGTGRKYVQQRKGRPRGRPRKKGRWAKRTKKTKHDTKETGSKHEQAELLGLRSDPIIERVADCIYNPDEDEDENIPVAELKVENIEGTNETRVLVEPLSSVTGGLTSGGSSSLQSVSSTEESVLPHGELGGPLMQLEPGTSLTIVTAEEAERHMAAGGLQLLTLPPDVLLSMTGSHQPHLITADQLQQLHQLQHMQVQQPVQHQRHQQQVQEQAGVQVQEQQAGVQFTTPGDGLQLCYSRHFS